MASENYVPYLAVVISRAGDAHIGDASVVEGANARLHIFRVDRSDDHTTVRLDILIAEPP